MSFVTPCTRLCTLDAATGLCLGCGRTVAEIAAWSTLPDADRRRIMAELPARMAAPPPIRAPLSGADAEPHDGGRAAPPGKGLSHG